MKKLNWQAIMKWLNARRESERAVLLAAGLGILTMVWLTFVHDALLAAQQDVARNITIAESTVLEERGRQNEIRATYTTDPNVFAQTRQRELREAANNANARLNELYGDLISPVQMTQALQTLLRRETTLDLRSLDNLPPEPLISGVATSGTAGSDAEGTSAAAIPAVQVFKHGIHLVFEGSFLDTVYYLRSLERLDSNFFWEKLEFDLTEYPRATISLDIYTLSTERGFLGV
jgi:MSHA biogenesis protein MshJ